MRKTFLFTASLFIMFSCANEELTEPITIEQIEQQKVNRHELLIRKNSEELTLLVEKINSKYNKPLKGKSRLDGVKFESAAKRQDLESGISYYTFPIYENDKTIRQLVVKENALGDILGHFIELESDTALEKEGPMEDFTGWFRIFNLDGTLESENRIGDQYAKNSTASKSTSCSSTITDWYKCMNGVISTSTCFYTSTTITTTCSSTGGGFWNEPLNGAYQDEEFLLHSSTIGFGDVVYSDINDIKINNNLTGKADCVYDLLLKSGVRNPHNLITDLFIEFGDGNIGSNDLTFLMSSELPITVGGKTELDNEGNFQILINANLMNTLSSLEVAAILVHEISHAFLGKHYNNSYSSFKDLYSQYINDTGIKNYSHDIMNDQFINRMATVLQNYDNQILSNFEDYKILASQGVFDLTSSQKSTLNAIKTKARNNDTKCKD